MRQGNAVVLCCVLSSSLVSAACGSSAGGNGEAPDSGPSGPGSTTQADGGGSTLPGAGSDGGLSSQADSASPDTDASSPGDDAASSSTDAAGNGDASAEDSGPFVPAAHPPFPLLVSSGGPVLAKPQVLPVFFQDYDQIAKVTEFVEGLPSATLASGTSFWPAAVSEYGVGDLTVLPAVTVAQNAPTTDSDPVAFLQSQLGTAGFKNITSSTILAVFYPSKTPLLGSCAAGTPGWGGYHDAFTNGSVQQPYAVMSECANFGSVADALDMVTVAASHEIIEASTDPYPSSNPAYVAIDTGAAGWPMTVLLQGNAEDGDMCTINDGFGRGPASFPFLMQRGWSNKAAKAGNLDPCSPDVRPAQPFVGAFPVMPDTVTIAGGGSGPGVVIAWGQTKTIEVDLFSFEPTPEFTVEARQSIEVNPPTLKFAWDKTTGKNGDKLHLTITAVTATAGGDTFILQAYLPGATDQQRPAWAGVVTH